MSEIYQLVGKEQRTYMKDGIQKFYCGLHLVGSQGGAEGVEGSAVQTVSCPRNTDPSRLRIGEWYELVYSHYKTAAGIRASVSDLRPVEVE